MSETWTIGELADRAAEVLRADEAVSGDVQGVATGGRGAGGNGRVREVPNERLIRWYTTIGLVDPPLGRRGRIALYGPRHLLQLVAIKRLQADGRSIADIQTALTGAPDALLASVARLAPPTTEPRPTTSFAAPGPTARNTTDATEAPAATDAVGAGRALRDRFWTRTSDTLPVPSPTARPSARPGARTAFDRPASMGAAPTAPRAPAAPPVVPAVRLAPDVTLVLGGADRAPSVSDLAAVLSAARPLLAVLHERGLAGPPAGSPAVPADMPVDVPVEGDHDRSPAEGSAS